MGEETRYGWWSGRSVRFSTKKCTERRGGGGQKRLDCGVHIKRPLNGTVSHVGKLLEEFSFQLTFFLINGNVTNVVHFIQDNRINIFRLDCGDHNRDSFMRNRKG